MRGADGNVDSFACADHDVAAVERDFRCTFNDDPMFCALSMFLITQPLAGQHLDALDLERAPLFEHGITTPGTPIELSHLGWSSENENPCSLRFIGNTD